MKKMKVITEENGFTLIESIISVVLVSLTMGSLFLAWYVIETRDRNLEQYWQYKETLELAYQITHQTLRANAKLATITIDGQGISFQGTDNKNWSFTTVSNNYILTHDTKEEILIPNTCNNTLFVKNGNTVDITLGVKPPENWTGPADLNINGKVYIRNP
jgi:prepilin-type N-terminal cleavage/methylation domain-containing protein